MDNGQNNKITACVTGGTGMVGSKIVDLLLKQNYSVRVLTRQQSYKKQGVETVIGSLEDEETLDKFLNNSDMIFHCAGELQNESKMWDVNVDGTERLLKQLVKLKIEYFCYISSAGVVGKTNLMLVDEETPCTPMNLYEKSKLAAEKFVHIYTKDCRVVILRPTNVIDDIKPGALMLPIKGSFLERIKVLLKGGECAHIVHADDVAAVALYFVTKQIEVPLCFFVSCDEEPLNTYAGIWSLYKAYEKECSPEAVKPALHLPLIVPYALRRLWRGNSNKGDVRYSSKKLISAGFVFPLGLNRAIQKIVSSRIAVS
jgi:nucleoside-diphosphate-sugar epimerase